MKEYRYEHQTYSLLPIMAEDGRVFVRLVMGPESDPTEIDFTMPLENAETLGEQLISFVREIEQCRIGDIGRLNP